MVWWLIKHLEKNTVSFLGYLANLRKPAISFVLLVSPFVRMEQLDFHWKDFYEIWYFRIFRKSVETIRVSLKSDENNTLLEDVCTFIKMCLLILLKIRNTADERRRGNQSTQFMFKNFFPKIVPFVK